MQTDFDISALLITGGCWRTGRDAGCSETSEIWFPHSKSGCTLSSKLNVPRSRHVQFDRTVCGGGYLDGKYTYRHFQVKHA